jgi:hypothetical protein
MAKKSDENREETKKSFHKLNENVKRDLQNRNDIKVIFVNYNEVLTQPQEHIKKICEFIPLSDQSLIEMIKAIDKNLYRQRR